MSPPSSVPPAEIDINHTLIQGLLADQHHDLSGLRLGDRYEGWDNVTTRLGDDLAVRMPRIAAAAPLLEREIKWLPKIGAAWGFGAPIPVRVGEAGRQYPWRWTVVPWFAGVDAAVSPLDGNGAADLGRALRQIHTLALAEAPHTPWRTTPLKDREAEAMSHLDALDTEADREELSWDADATRELWREAAALPWRAATWVHADIHVKNLVVRERRLTAILDWGEAGAGDPAQDIGQAWLLCAEDDVARALAAYGEIDDKTQIRAKGEAITTAARLISSGDRGFIESGWRGLHNLGLASCLPPHALDVLEED